MNWKDAMMLTGILSEYGFSDLESGLHVDFTAEHLQQLVSAVEERCALLCEAHQPGTSPAEIAAAIRRQKV